MDSTACVILSFAIVLVSYVINRLRFKSRNLPPGPTGLPFIGNLHTLADDPLASLSKWNKIYGNTISVQLASRTMVILHDYDTAKTVFNDENTTGRDQDSVFRQLFHDRGLLMTEGDLWKEHRRFALSALRDLGMGKGWFENAILDEAAELNAVLRSYAGSPFNPHPNVSVAASNIIGALVFGKHFEHSDTRFQDLSTAFGRNFRLAQELTVLQYFPFLRRIPFGSLNRKWKLLHETSEMSIMNFSQALLTDHSNQRDADVKNDYINSYMAEKEKQRTMERPSTFTDKQLLVSVRNLFGAGTDTATTTLLWAFIYMVENPEIQQKVHEEMDEKVGDRQIRIEDRVLLKYTDAVTLEIQRLASVAPLGVPHTNFNAIAIDGYDIPPRTLIHQNTYAIHRDPRYWSHPDIMYPEHFIDGSGAVRIPKGFVPFGIGKRECLGEGLARMEIFLMFANILQQFRITYGPKNRPSSSRYSFSLVRAPLPYEVCFIPRS